MQVYPSGPWHQARRAWFDVLVWELACNQRTRHRTFAAMATEPGRIVCMAGGAGGSCQRADARRRRVVL